MFTNWQCTRFLHHIALYHHIKVCVIPHKHVFSSWYIDYYRLQNAFHLVHWVSLFASTTHLSDNKVSSCPSLSLFLMRARNHNQVIASTKIFCTRECIVAAIALSFDRSCFCHHATHRRFMPQSLLSFVSYTDLWKNYDRLTTYCSMNSCCCWFHKNVI